MLSIILLMGLSACGDSGDISDSTSGSVTKAGMSIQVEESTGKMSIKRPMIDNPTPMGQADTWTIFVYLCGSDLESRLLFGGAASSDIEEMCKATETNQVRFVVETGGSDYWHNSKIDSDSLGRFVIEKGTLKDVDTTSQALYGQVIHPV